MDLFSVLELIGGLALFLYGMKVMGDGLEKRAGGKLKRILENLTSNRIKGAALGAGTTAIIQSSSATSVMTIGFVNSGMMKLRQAISVVMGACLGTTVTAWILSLTGVQGESLVIQLFKPSSFVPVLAAIAVILLMTSKRNKTKDVATILMGFSILMFGMEMMSGAVKPLAGDPEFVKILTIFSNPVLGVLTGTVVTAIIQSSSASVGILQALSLTGSITYGTAIPIIVGQNIGTVITALLSAIGSNKNGKRVAVAMLYYKLASAILFLAVYYLLDYLVGFTFKDMPIDTVGIAIVHTSFNVMALTVFLPLQRFIEKLACLTVKDGKKEEVFSILDERLLATPALAVQRCRSLMDDMARISCDSLLASIALTGSYNAKQADSVLIDEDKLDIYEDKIGAYLVRLSEESLTERDSHDISKMLHAIGDFERIGDHAVNIMEAGSEIYEKKITFSPTATHQLEVMGAAVREILVNTMEAFIADDVALAAKVEPLEEVVDDLRDAIKNSHISRLQSGECTIEMGFILSDLLTNYERVSDHCSNIAMLIIESNVDVKSPHQYINAIKHDDSSFEEEYERYKNKYSL